MQKIKKPLSIILAVLMVMSVFIAVPMSASALTIDDVQSLLSSMEAKINDYYAQGDWDHARELMDYCDWLDGELEDADGQITPELESAYNEAYEYFMTIGGAGVSYPDVNNVYRATNGWVNVTVSDLQPGDVLVTSDTLSVRKGDCDIVLVGGTYCEEETLSKTYLNNVTLGNNISFLFGGDYARIIDADNAKNYDPVYNNALGNAYMVIGKENGTVYLAGYYFTIYTVTWKNGDTVLKTDTVEKDAVPAYTGNVPTKAENEQYSYTFTGWTDSSNTFYSKDSDLPAASKDETYTATYSETLRSYTITWKDGDDQTLKSESVAYGTTPSYTGATPTKAADDTYTYTFAGWSPEITAVTGDVTYTATYTETAKAKPWPSNYTITTGGVYNCPSTMSKFTIVSGGTEENPVIINITDQTSGAPIWLTSGYLKIVGNNNTFLSSQDGFVFFSDSVMYKPNGDAHLTVTDLTITSNSVRNQYIQITPQKYKCQSSFENVTFKNWNANGSGAVVIGSETTHTLKNCTFEDNTGYGAGGISVRKGSDVTMEGCTFKNCTRTSTSSLYGGGAVWVDNNTKLTLDGCTFEDCTGKCGAVGIESTASLTLKGNTTITGNENGNLYLPTGVTVKIDEDFNGTVGVTTETAPTDSASVTLSSGLADTQAALANNNIVSDNENYGVRYDSNKLFLVVPATYTVTWKNGDTTLETDTDVEEGATPTYDGATPTKASDKYYDYTFSGWTPAVAPVTEDVTYTATFTATAKPKDLFPQHSITLGGNIGVNFYIDSAAADFTHAGSAVVKFTWDGGGEDRTKEVNLKELTTDGDGYYKATVDVVAAQMAHKIHAEVWLNGAKLEQTDDYSVQDYAETVFATPEKYDSEKPVQLAALAQALLNYGANAQTVFATSLNEHPALANKTVGNNGYEGVTADQIEGAINGEASDLNAVAAQLGAKYYTNSLIYLSKNTLRIYFTPTSYPGEIPNAGAYDGNLSGYYYYVDHANIPAAELDNQQTFTVGGTTFTFSALDYAAAVVNSDMKPEQQNLAKALYLYNQKANAYFDAAPAPAENEVISSGFIDDFSTLNVGDYIAKGVEYAADDDYKVVLTGGTYGTESRDGIVVRNGDYSFNAGEYGMGTYSYHVPQPNVFIEDYNENEKFYPAVDGVEGNAFVVVAKDDTQKIITIAGANVIQN